MVKRSRSKQLKQEEYSTRTKPQPVAMDNGLMGVKKQMTVNITCDHRIIYGAHAAAFLKDLATLIETNPESLTL